MLVARYLFTALLFSACTTTIAGDYVLTINGKDHELDLEQETTVKLADGTELKLNLKQKEYLEFKADLFAFEHKNQFRPNRTDLGDGLLQTAIMTPMGTGILVQEYKQMDPSSLIDMMVKELTKEEVEYGYKLKEVSISKKVGDAEFKGKKAITTYTGEEWTRSVLAYGKKDKGLLIVTFIEKDNYEKEKHLIDQLWKSIKLTDKMK